MTLLEFIVRAARNVELRREAAQRRANPQPPVLIPAGMPLPRPVRDVGGHEVSGEGGR